MNLCSGVLGVDLSQKVKFLKPFFVYLQFDQVIEKLQLTTLSK